METAVGDEVEDGGFAGLDDAEDAEEADDDDDDDDDDEDEDEDVPMIVKLGLMLPESPITAALN